MGILLSQQERLDELGRKGYRIIQNTNAFCFGIDAVLLADFTAAASDERVLDLGCGNGILPLLLKAREKGGEITGLEIQPEQVSLARRNVSLNGLEQEIKIRMGDLTMADQELPKAGFDVILTNPPYLKKGEGLISPMEAKALARHELACTLKDVIRVSSVLVKPGGRFYMVHRCGRMDEALELLRHYRMTPKRIRIVHSAPDHEGELFLVEAIRGAKEGLKLLAPCYIYDMSGQYTDEIRRIYQGAGMEEED